MHDPMIRKTLLAATAAVLLATPARSDDHKTYRSLWDAVADKPGCTQRDQVDLVVVTCNADATAWYFTKDGHPAHPGVVERPLPAQNGDGHPRLEAWSFGSAAQQPVFKTLMRQIWLLDQQAKLNDQIAELAQASAQSSQPLAPQITGNWAANNGESIAVLAASHAFFAFEDRGAYDQAYTFMDPSLTARQTLDAYQHDVEGRIGSVGHVSYRTLHNVDWEKDAPSAPPGIFAALGYTAMTEHGALCGTLVWKLQADGFLTLTREETNLVPDGLSDAEKAKVKARFHCIE